MTKSHGNGTSLSEEVRKEISSTPHVKTSLGEGIVNYSALARKIMPEISKKLNRQLNEESVIVAIKRYADELETPEMDNSYLEMFAASQVLLQDNMSYTHFKKNEKVISKIEKLFAEENWNIGEMRVMIHGADQVMIIAKESRVKELMEECRDDLIHTIGGRSLITFNLPIESYSAYGIIAEVTSQLARKGISIELLSSPPDLHIMVDENDAERAYSTLKQLITEAKNSLREKEK